MIFKDNGENFPYQFLQHVMRTPDKVALTFLDEHNQAQDVTYHELLKRVNGVSNAILESSREGEPVLLLYAPGINFIAAFIACLCTGRLAIPAYPPMNFSAVSRLETIIKSAKPTLILSEDNILKHLKKIPYIKYLLFPSVKKRVLRSLRIPENIGFLFESVAQMTTTDILLDDRMNLDNISASGGAFIQYTSGTTSSPKGVIVSHENIAHNLHIIREAFDIHSASKGFIWLPPYHDMGLIGGILVPLYHGFPVVLTSPFNFIKKPNIWLESISKYRATISGGPNFAYSLCIKRFNDEDAEKLDLSSWETAFCGAEPIQTQTMQKFMQKFKKSGFKSTALVPCYGCAESTLMVSSVRPDEELSSIAVDRDSLGKGQVVFGSGDNSVDVVDCGVPLLDVKIRSQETGEFLDENQVGEVLIRGASVSSGYWEEPEKTAAAFKVGPDGNQYYHSGDLGFLSQGRLYITGRIHDLIIVGGRNFFAHEIESVVGACSADIRAGCCVAYESDGESTGQLYLALELVAGKSKNHQELVQLILLAVNKHFGIAVQEIAILKPHSILRTTSGKLQRRQTAALIKQHPENIVFHFKSTIGDTVEDNSHPVAKVQTHSRDITAKIVEEAIISILNANYSGLLKCKSSTSLESLGLDSMMYVKLIGSLQQKLSIDFEVNDIMLDKNQTIGDLAKEVARLAKCQEHISRLEQLPKVKSILKRYDNLAQHHYEQLFMRAFEGPANSNIYLDGKPYINFASYNYLGLSGDEHMKQFIKEHVDEYGSSVSASRLVAGNRVLTEKLEQAIAKFIGYPDSIVFTAGYQTVLTAITHLFGSSDAIIYDELAHNSSLLGAYYSGAQLFTFKHNDTDSLEKQLTHLTQRFDRVLIITEGVFSMDGDIAPIDNIVRLKKKYGCFLMIDEAHSLGVIGQTGRGVIEYFNLSPDDIDLIVGTLSKSLASCGGFVCASKELIQYMKFSAPGFVFSAGITPANTAAALYAINRLQEEPALIKRMQVNADYFIQKLQALGLDVGQSKNTPIVPVIIRNSEKTLEASYQLFCKGIYAPPIISPGVTEHEARIRFFITALHDKEQLDACVQELAQLKALLIAA